MTSGEIKETPQEGRSEAGWLKEIAYQLALLNERMNPLNVPHGNPYIEQPIKRGPGRPPKIT